MLLKIIAVVATVMLSVSSNAFPAQAETPPDDVFLSVAGPGAEVLTKEEIKLPTLGMAVHYANLYRRTTDEKFTLTVDEAGNFGNLETFLQREEAARYEKNGCINEDLAAKISAATDDDPIDVILWGKSYEPAVVKETVLSDPVAAIKAEWTRLQAVADANAAVALAVHSVGGKPTSSDFFPIVRATLTPSQIEGLKYEPSIFRAYYHEKEPRPATVGYSYPYAVYASYLDALGWDGTGVKIANMEQYQPDDYSCLTGIQAIHCPGSQSLGSSHTRWTQGIMRSNSSSGCDTPIGGIADDALYYIANYRSTDPNCDDTFDDAVAWAMGNYVNVMVRSEGYGACNTTNLGPDDKVFDYVARIWPYPTIVEPTGNGGAGCNCGNRFYNGIIVGGSNDMGTDSRSDDTMYDYTSSKNPPANRELPLMAAPAQVIHAADWTDSGTSAAAPIVAGLAASLMEYNSSLKFRGEAIRAILLATADKDVDGHTLYFHDTWDDRDGAGEVSGLKAWSLADPSKKWSGTCLEEGHDYFDMSLTTGWDANGFWNTVWCNTSSTTDKQVRVTITWDSTASCDPSPQYDCTTDAPDADLNLWIYDRSDGSLDFYSLSSLNNYEFRQFTAPAGKRYNFKVQKNSASRSQTRFAIAWTKW